MRILPIFGIFSHPPSDLLRCLLEPNLSLHKLSVLFYLHLLSPRRLVECRTQLILPPYPILLPLEDNVHCLSECTSIGRGLPELLAGFLDRLVNPFLVIPTESEVHLQRAIPGSGPRCFGGLRKREEVVQEDE